MFAVVKRALDQGLGKSGNSGNRRLELVGDICDKIFPRLLESLELRDIVEDSDEARQLAFIEKKGRNLDDTVLLQGGVQLHFGDAGFPLFPRVFHERQEFVVANDFDERFSLECGLAEQCSGRETRQADRVVSIDHEQGIGYTSQDRVQPVLFLLTGGDALLQLPGHGVQALGDLVELSGSFKIELSAELSLGKGAGKIPYPCRQPPYAVDLKQGYDAGGQQDREDHGKDLDPEQVDRRIDVLEWFAQTDEASGMLSADDLYRHIEEIVLQGIAEADRRTGPVQRGLLNLLTVAVVLHAGRIGFRVPKDPSVRRDDRHPGSGCFFELFAKAVEGG